jgi:predicted pyridoxine 5'-phosphate oxidase superfamily flavin-nucleotide-binding protein
MSTTIAPGGPQAATGQAGELAFHTGELAVQRRAGVEADAARLAPMLAPAQLRGGLAAFLADRTFAVLAARDPAGRLWASPLTGPAGFLAVTSPTTLQVTAAMSATDPLHGLPPGQQVGMIAVEFAARRRVRLNGTLTEASEGRLAVDVEQAFGNCPQYIQQRVLAPDDTSQQADPGEARRGTALDAADTELIRRADTFFLGTTHPERGTDASHRGGPPGFVRVEGSQLWWPDYPGNNMFNSFGNLAVNPEAALLFIDFAAGTTLHLSGDGGIEWGQAGAPGDDGRTGRRARFDLRRLVAGRLPAREVAHRPYPHNPALSD